MTKTLRVIGTLLTAVVLALNFTACGDDDDDDDKNGKGSTMSKEDFPGNYYLSSITYNGETLNYKENKAIRKLTITNITGSKYSFKNIDVNGNNADNEFDLQDFDFSKGKKSKIIIPENELTKEVYIKVTGQYTFQLSYVYYNLPDETDTYTRSGH